MSDDPCHEAAEVLRVMGFDVQPTGDDFGLWLVDGEMFSDAELVSLAHVIGLMAGTETIQ
ncbi:hypothetical protein [Methylobacterium sp. WL8]|uniref:hypothetical protein n=1 Tax=Methylobacterium sp. WL8 TaxID=2603899 RepID=UPI0011C9366A|nr:hypothetical protein [Methylobacterium sp. WL8]TXN81456.1 hypothetical protein FV234_13650 [Methylobacterium sp. WL8]